MERLSYTLNCRRSILPWKSFCVASSINELCSNLEGHISKPTRSSVAPKLAFIFTGQGAQWYAMGRELLSHEIFRTSLKEADAYLKSLECPWSLFGKFLWELILNICSQILQKSSARTKSHPRSTKPLIASQFARRFRSRLSIFSVIGG
jgi:Acyl transferase domain